MEESGMENMDVAMGLIINAGDAKSLAVEAIAAAKEGDFAKADDLMAQADKALIEAHDMQTDMLVKAARGEKIEIHIYMVHAQDHLMTAMNYKDLAKEVIALYKKYENH